MARVLLVDDEDTVREMLRVILTSEGHEVHAVDDGVAAMELIRSEQPFDLLVTDLRMKPVNGIEVLREAHARRPDLPSVVVSAYYSDNISQEIQALGCSAFVRKPFRMDDILKAIQRVLSQGVAEG